MPTFTLSPDVGASAGNYSINTAPVQPAPPAPAKSTGDPDLAPGQKRPEGA